MHLAASLQAYRRDIDAPWFDKPWDLNLFVVRSDNVALFDDHVVAVTCDESNRPIVFAALATGDAWGDEWINPTHPDGCVYVLDGHYPGGLEYGTFKGRKALRQRRPFRNVRWPRSAGRIPSVTELEQLGLTAGFSDIRGTHVHNRYNRKAPARPLRDDSEGCTVVLWRHAHAGLIELDMQQKHFHGTSIVSPTYMQLRNLDRKAISLLTD